MQIILIIYQILQLYIQTQIKMKFKNKLLNTVKKLDMIIQICKMIFIFLENMLLLDLNQIKGKHKKIQNQIEFLPLQKFCFDHQNNLLQQILTQIIILIIKAIQAIQIEGVSLCQ
ncbi:unnamed protein product [Paramecium sonneborni]|uniref:Uncharacterized protein n=1 Tax=Paramecium sonneborni TaxID=65129 RepID=A0A8S1PLN7_9CILI|nr:unnamed protein product [Paramecium sonneborni]